MSPKFPSFGGAPKLLIPLALGAAGVVGAGFFFARQASELAQLRGQLAQSRKQNAELDTKNQELAAQMSSLQYERKALEERVSSLRTQLSSLSADLEQARAGLGELQGRSERVGQERTQLQAQLSSVIGERDEARKRLERLEQDNDNLQRSMGRLRERLTLVDRDYRQLAEKLAEVERRPNSSLAVVSSVGPSATGARPADEVAQASTIPGTVELPPIIVRKDQAGMSLPIRGRVVEINEPHNFIVVDKGSQDGVRVGSGFQILRGANPVGYATAVRVRPQLAACDVVRAKTPGQVQVGDLAVQSGP